MKQKQIKDLEKIERAKFVESEIEKYQMSRLMREE